MSCPPDCKMPTPAQAHCSVCHRTFGGVRAFDRHRSKGTCVDPAPLGYIERGGVWREAISDAKRGRLSALRDGS